MNPDSSVVPGVEQAVESQIANIVPPVIPAIADLLDEDMNHDPILEGSNVEGALNNVVHQGKSIIDQITNGNDVNIDPELRALLDEVSGIVDTTEGQLQSPVCVVSSAINGVPTQVVVPCVDAGADATTTVIQLAPSAYSNPPDAATVVVPSHPVENSDAPQSEPVQAPPQIPQDPSSATSEPAQDLPPPSQSSGSSEPPLDQDVTQPPPDQGSSPALPAPEIPRPSLDQTDVQRPPAQETSPPPPVQDPAQPPPNQHDAQPSEVQNVPQPWPTAPQPSTQDPVIPDDNQKSWPIPSDLPTEPLPNPVQPDIDGQPPSSASVVLPSSQQSVAPIDSPNTDGGTSAGAPAVPQWPLPGDTESQPTGTLPGTSSSRLDTGYVSILLCFSLRRLHVSCTVNISNTPRTGSKPLQDGTPTTPNNPGAVDSAPETCAGDFDASNPACSSTIPNDSLNCGFLHGPCNGRRGFKCNECLNGWFCPPMETPAQVAPCGLGWPCYHCADGWFCASDEVLDSQNLQNTIASSPADGNTVGGAGTVSQAGAAETNDYLYLGCFQGGASRSLLGSVPVDYLSGTMSTMICVNHCFERGYTFAGTENGHECWCGETLRVDAVKLPESSCQLPCHGHQNSICGGQGAMSLFADPEEV